MLLGALGLADGETEGSLDGLAVGNTLGESVGAIVGADVGISGTTAPKVGSESATTFDKMGSLLSTAATSRVISDCTLATNESND